MLLDSLSTSVLGNVEGASKDNVESDGGGVPGVTVDEDEDVSVDIEAKPSVMAFAIAFSSDS